MVQNQGKRRGSVACATIKPLAADNGANPPVRPGFHGTVIRLRSAPWPMRRIALRDAPCGLTRPMRNRIGPDRSELAPGHKRHMGDVIMVIDDTARIALGFLVAILAVTGGLTWFVLSRMK